MLLKVRLSLLQWVQWLLSRGVLQCALSGRELFYFLLCSLLNACLLWAVSAVCACVMRVCFCQAAACCCSLCCCCCSFKNNFLSFFFFFFLFSNKKKHAFWSSDRQQHHTEHIANCGTTAMKECLLEMDCSCFWFAKQRKQNAKEWARLVSFSVWLLAWIKSLYKTQKQRANLQSHFIVFVENWESIHFLSVSFLFLKQLFLFSTKQQKNKNQNGLVFFNSNSTIHFNYCSTYCSTPHLEGVSTSHQRCAQRHNHSVQSTSFPWSSANDQRLCAGVDCSFRAGAVRLEGELELQSDHWQDEVSGDEKFLCPAGVVQL